MTTFDVSLDIQAAQMGLDQWAIDVISRFAWGLHLLAEDAMTLSKLLVPVRTGYLRSTGRVEPPVVDLTAGTAHCEMGYSAEYAAPVHELHATKSKFLEQAMFEVSRTAQQRLEQWMAQPSTMNQRPMGMPPTLPKA